jgi:hypothetical protein
MGHAYTPGLKVSAAAGWMRRRVLPIPGEVLVEVGQAVEPDTVVARALLPGNVVTSHISRQLGVAPADVAELMLVQHDEPVEKDQIIARSKGIFGMFKQTATAPTTGVIESVSKVSGQAIFREAPIPVEVRAYVAGMVSAVEEGLGCEISSTGTMVQGIFGIGPETCGPIGVVSDDPTRPLRPDDLREEHAGAVVVGGSMADLATLRRAIEIGVAALVVGGVDAADLKGLLGYDLGVAITGDETVGLTLVVTEGFGPLAMSRRTHQLLSRATGRIASVSGATQIRAGVLRPEVLVPGAVESVEQTAVSGDWPA